MTEMPIVPPVTSSGKAMISGTATVNASVIRARYTPWRRIAGRPKTTPIAPLAITASTAAA